MTVKEQRYNDTAEMKEILNKLPDTLKEVLVKNASAIEMAYNVGVTYGRQQARTGAA